MEGRSLGLAGGKGFLWRNRDEKPTQLTAGPLDFSILRPARMARRFSPSVASRRAEVVRYDSRSGEFIPYLLESRLRAWHFPLMGNGLPTLLIPTACYGGVERTAASGFSSPFRLCERICRAGPLMRNKSSLVPSFPVRSGISSLSRARAELRSDILPSEQSQMDANWSPDGHSLIFASDGVLNAPISILDLGTRHVSVLPGSMDVFPHIGRRMESTLRP